MLGIVEHFSDRVEKYTNNSGERPKVIIVNDEEFSTLLEVAYFENPSEIRPIEKAMEGSLFNIPVKVIPGLELRLTRFLSDKQLTLFLVDEDTNLRTLAYRVLKERHVD